MKKKLFIIKRLRCFYLPESIRTAVMRQRTIRAMNLQRVRQKELWSTMTELEREKVREERFLRNRTDADAEMRKIRVEKRKKLRGLSAEQKAKWDKDVKY